MALKGLSHEIFGPVLWAVWIYLGLNVNRLWLNFNDAPFILVNYFKFLCVSGQTVSEILRISEKGWRLSWRFSNIRRFLVSGFSEKRCLGCKYFSENRRISEKGSRHPTTSLSDTLSVLQYSNFNTHLFLW